MQTITIKEENPILSMTRIIKELKNGIIVTRSSQSNGNTEVKSYIISNEKLKFLSSNSPSISMFVDYSRTSIIEEMFKGTVIDTIIYEDFIDGFSHAKLIKFSKDYDKKYKGKSTNFYVKYKKLFIENC